MKSRNGKIDRFERLITLEGNLDEATRTRLLEIADKCPVHRTLEAGAAVVTREVSPDKQRRDLTGSGEAASGRLAFQGLQTDLHEGQQTARVTV